MGQSATEMLTPSKGASETATPRREFNIEEKFNYASRFGGTDFVVPLDVARGAVKQLQAERDQLRAEVAKAQEDRGKIQDDADIEWLDAIASRWNELTGKPWDVRDGELREEGVVANINALFDYIVTLTAALDKATEALSEAETYVIAVPQGSTWRDHQTLLLEKIRAALAQL